MNIIKKHLGIICAFVLAGIVIALCWVALWKTACSDAKIFNQVKGTSYTCSDFWWSASQINKLK